MSLPGPGCVAALQSFSALALRFRACSHHCTRTACIIFDFNVPFGSFPMPGLAKRCKDDPTFWSPPAHPCPVGGSWPGRFGLPRFYKYCVINKFNLAFRLTAFARGKAWHAWGPSRPGAQALSIFNLSTATDMWLYCCILTPCHKGCPISSRGRRATGMKGSSAC